MTTRNQQHQNEAEAELIDLPDEEKVTPSICSPKIFIITLLAAYFVSQNIYHYIMNPPKPVDPSLPDPDYWENFWELYDRFKLYLIVSVVGFIVFYFLRQSNDNAEFQRYEAIRKKQQQQQLQRKKIQSERQQKILRQLQEQERVASEKQFSAARKFAQQYAAQAKTQKEEPKQIDPQISEEQNRKED